MSFIYGGRGHYNPLSARRPRSGGDGGTAPNEPIDRGGWVLPLTPATLPLVSITAHRAAVGTAIPCGVTVDPRQVNSGEAGDLSLIRRLGVVGTDGHPLKGTGGEVGGGDVTHGMRSVELREL